MNVTSYQLSLNQQIREIFSKYTDIQYNDDY